MPEAVIGATCVAAFPRSWASAEVKGFFFFFFFLPFALAVCLRFFTWPLRVCWMRPQRPTPIASKRL